MKIILSFEKLNLSEIFGINKLALRTEIISCKLMGNNRAQYDIYSILVFVFTLLTTTILVLHFVIGIDFWA